MIITFNLLFSLPLEHQKLSRKTEWFYHLNKEENLLFRSYATFPIASFRYLYFFTTESLKINLIPLKSSTFSDLVT